MVNFTLTPFISEGEKEYIYNGLGCLVSVIADGVAKNYMVDPMGFGNNLFEGESVENDFEFVGQLGVREMGEDLIYMRNRFYSPALGRFMAEDPIGLAGGDVSFYRYVQNDPINWVDPLGLYAPTWGEIVTVESLLIASPEPTTTLLGLGLVIAMNQMSGDGLIHNPDGTTSDWDEFGSKGEETSTDKATTNVTENAKDETCDEAVPDDECEDDKGMCSDIHDWPSCAGLRNDWEYLQYTREGAEAEVAFYLGHKNFTCQRSGSDATGGPLPNGRGGKHYNCYNTSDGEHCDYSLVSSPCCNNDNKEDEGWGVK